MKKLIFIFLLILVFTINIYGQELENQELENLELKNLELKRVTIQTSPILLFSDVIFMEEDRFLFAMDLESQFLLSRYNSLSLTLTFITGNNTINVYNHEISSYENLKEYYTQINLTPMLIHRPFGTGIWGFYIGIYPNVGIIFINEESKDNAFYTELGFGMKMGYKWVFNSGFTIQIGGGMGKNYVLPNKPDRYISEIGGTIKESSTELHLIDFKLGFSF